jgi:hypothetical protein
MMQVKCDQWKQNYTSSINDGCDFHKEKEDKIRA